MMKVHFSASMQKIDEYLPTYQFITDLIKQQGHTLLKDWVADCRNDRQQYTDDEWEDITTKTFDAIKKADVVIIEASTTSFSMGYQASMALSYKKPLLILFDAKYQQYIIDSNNSLKRAEVYHNKEELQRAITTFLRENDIDNKSMRFNMVMDREVYNYLHWESVNSGRTKAQIIREVIKDLIARN